MAEKNIMYPKDADGILLHEGDRVFTYDFPGHRIYGTLGRGKTFRGKEDWYVDYDDGEGCVVVSFSHIWKA